MTLNKNVSELKVMAVDDNTMMINLMIKMLGDLGFEKIDTAGDGKEAFQKIIDAKDEGERYDIVFLDWNMPGMYGYDVLRECREIIELGDMAIVMVTAENQKRSVLEAMKVGATSYITKPVSPDELSKKVNQVLEWMDSR